MEVEQLPGSGRRGLQPLAERLVTMADRVRQVVKQTRARIFEGITTRLDQAANMLRGLRETSQGGWLHHNK